MTPGIPAPVLSRTTPLTLPSGPCAHAGALHISATSANAIASGFCRRIMFRPPCGLLHTADVIRLSRGTMRARWATGHGQDLPADQLTNLPTYQLTNLPTYQVAIPIAFQ